MRLNRIAAIAAAALATCSLAYAIGPIAPKVDLPSTRIAPIPVHSTCHQNLRTHGGAYPLHYHRQSDCKMIISDNDDSYDDCHHSVLRHYLPGYGKVWHRHVGSSCSVQLYEQDSGPAPGVGGCVQIGPSTICGFSQ